MRRITPSHSARTTMSRCSATSRLLLMTLLLFTFLGGARAIESHYLEISSDFENSQSLVAFVKINGEYVTSDNYENFEIAAFVGDECRGHIFMNDYTETFGDPYPIVELDIWYNATGGEEVSFKMYDHSTSTEYDDCAPNISIVTGKNHTELYSNSEEAVELNFETSIPTGIQYIELNSGWNWLSTNVDITLDDLKAALVEALPEANIIINSQGNGSAVYKNGQWRGALNNLDVSQMYMIYTSDGCEIVLEGMPIDPDEHPATICPEYNWIGYPFSEGMALTDAFAGFAVNGDRIMSKDQNDQYNRGRWSSSFTLQPGQGYIYQSAASEDRTFVFPNDFKAVSGSKSNESEYESYWTYFDQGFNYHDYKFNQPLVATIQIDDQFIDCDGNWADLEVGAFVGDECRGYAFLEGRYVEEFDDPYPVIEIPIYYTTPGEEVTFKLFDHYTGYTGTEYGECTVVNNYINTGEFYVEYIFGDDEPVVLNFEKGNNNQNVELNSGWNWLSTNVEITLDDLKAALQEALPGVSSITISQSGRNTTYNGSTWRGTLHDIDVSQMFMINSPESCEIMLEGMPIDPDEHPIIIKNGDSWIGFPLSGGMALNNAFAGFAVNGDVIISQTAFAVFTGGMWRGTLTTLEPGQGYIYKSAASEDRIFVFPNYFKAVSGSKSYENGLDSHWTNLNGQEFNYHDFKFNQPLVATIQIDDQFINYDDNWESLEVGAFVGGECRGYAFLEGRYVEDFGDPYPVIEMPIYYNDANEEVTFKLYDHSTETEYGECAVINNSINTGVSYVEYNVIDDDAAVVLNFTSDALELADDDLEMDEDQKNSALISAAVGAGGTKKVKLAGRTLYKDGEWNTICLPFDVTLDDSPLSGSTAMELVDATMAGAHVTLTFNEVGGELEAGKPYIIKWEDDGSENIYEPVFTDVTISSTEGQTLTFAEDNVQFIGYYDAFYIDESNEDIYYLTSGSTFKHTASGRTLNACRGYFRFSEAAKARQFVLNFGENGGTTTGIVEVDNGTNTDGSTYDLLGRKAPRGQLRKGLYIKDGKKVVVK